MADIAAAMKKKTIGGHAGMMVAKAMLARVPLMLLIREGALSLKRFA